MNVPLAERIRPDSLDLMVGQKHIFGTSWLKNIVSSAHIPNMILYGPPGTGKTTLAQIISRKTNKRFFKLNATNCGISDIKNIITDLNDITCPNGAILYLDEIQYFNKKQQQSILEFIENGKITFMASTTENPYFYVYPAVLSRCSVFEFKPVDKQEINNVLKRAVKFLEDESKIKLIIPDEVLEKISCLCKGDVRRALNALELCVASSSETNGVKTILYDDVLKQNESSSYINHNKTGDEHYDLLSAFQKSMRGSDADASIYYLARLLHSGEMLSAIRRLLVCACEDVGLAQPGIFQSVKALTDISMQVGMPEAQIPLADAVLMVALSPKSNSAYKAVNSASSDIENGLVYPVPRHLLNVHCDGTQTKKSPLKKYLYPHDYKNSWTAQQYLPSELKNKKYYYPKENKNETAFKNYRENIAKQSFK